jgi:two-component system nitrogen regulation response regulator NtrX
LRDFCAANNFRRKAFAPEAMEALRKHRWRGNVRELKNTVERLLIMVESDEIKGEDVIGALRRPTEDSSALTTANTLRDFKEAAERTFLVSKLRESGWNISATAQAIGTPRSNLYKKLDQYGITQETDG